MNKIIENENIIVENMIYNVRGIEVMLDSDLAKIYQVDTKRINEAVTRNREKFPDRFSWTLTAKEVENLWSQNATANISAMSRANPRVFTEQGVYMLATILKSKVATKVTIAIMDTFVRMRHYINYNKSFLPHRFLLLEDKVDENTRRINELFDKFDPKDIVKDYIFYKGDFYDAYSVILDIFNKARTKIIIIDNYTSKKVLDTVKDINVNVTIISSNIDKVLKKKYEKQYKNVKFIYSDEFHDRFIIIDECGLYSVGSSLKDIGKKCFAINEIDSREILDIILEKINND